LLGFVLRQARQMTCNHHGNVTICRGPEMERCKELEQRSAVYCDRCRRRTVHTLVSYMPKMDSETMDEGQMMAAAFYGPELRLECSCGGYRSANHELEW
jgi:hypothetical protein